MRTRPVTTKEYNKIMKKLEKEDTCTFLAVSIAADTGLRVSDVLNLTVDKVKRSMCVIEQKTGNKRSVTLSPLTFKRIKNFINYNHLSGDERLIARNRSTIFRHLKKVSNELLLESVSMHSFRKFYARKFMKKHGVKRTQKELGHKYLSTTLLYLVDENDLEKLC